MIAVPDADRTEQDDLVRIGRLVSRYRRRAAVERLRLYRQHLQVTVTRATPLLALVAAEHGRCVHAALHRLRPPYGWPQVARVQSWASIAEVLRHRNHHWSVGARDPDNARSVMVRGLSDPRLSLSLFLIDGSLELTARMGEVTIRTRKEKIELILSFHLADTLELALIGRPVRCLVGHQWFGDDAWTIVEIDRLPGVLTRTVVTVMAGDVPFSLPWSRLLGDI